MAEQFTPEDSPGTAMPRLIIFVMLQEMSLPQEAKEVRAARVVMAAQAAKVHPEETADKAAHPQTLLPAETLVIYLPADL